jgi:DNA-binding NarL/FixJ family response regulator
MTRVLIVDDQRTAREVMEIAVKQSKKYSIVKTIMDAGNAYLYCMNGRVDLILMDVYTLDGENGIEAAAKIKRDFPHIKIIIVTSMPEESFIRKAQEAGCDSFWYKDVGEEDLLTVMDRTMAGESVYPDEVPVIKIGLAKSTEFTKRELDVLRELVNGRSQKDTADILGIKYDSVRTHLKSILVKTGYDTPSRFIAEVSHKNYMIPGFYKSSPEDEDTEEE